MTAERFNPPPFSKSLNPAPLDHSSKLSDVKLHTFNNHFLYSPRNSYIQALKNREGTRNGRGSHTHNTQYGRMSKIEFPKFHGGDVKGWVYRCKQFFKTDGIEEERKIELASMHMYDQALVWHQQYVKKYGDRTPWEMYEGEVVKRFVVFLESSGENNNELVAEAEGEIFEDCVEEVLTIDSTPQISLNALCGLNSFQTMRVKGMFRKHTLHILWSLQKETFTSDVMFLPLEGCEMVLGIQCKNKEKHFEKAMIEAPVLALPNFSQEFVVETDVSGTGIGAVLCQNEHPIAYLSKTLVAKHQSLSTYEKEFLVVVAALEK
nr:TMV resistance protein N [Tanacetum cinerariifolium]